MSNSDEVNENEVKLEFAAKHIKEISKFRSVLPSAGADRSKVSIWSVLKQCVDKELYRFTLPIIWNEPLTLLQRTAENIKYADQLLDMGAKRTDPIERMKSVAAFLISCTSINVIRLSKPFNPLLGETYELVNPEKSYRICCEQVSHHPPVTAFYSESLKCKSTDDKTTGSAGTNESPLWKYYGSVNPVLKLNIYNACVEALPEGIQTIEFPHHDETYTWHNPKVYAHNLIIGKLWFECTGQVEIVNHKSKCKCVLDFKPYSWFSGLVSRVEGYIADANDNKLVLLGGKWDEYFYATSQVAAPAEFYKLIQQPALSSEQLKSNQIELLWKKNVLDQTMEKLYPEFYNFTQFTLILNDLLDEHKKPTLIKTDSHEGSFRPNITMGPLPPTDCRYRPDMKLYEKGLLTAGADEKTRLEEKQREKRRKVEAGELEAYKPLWFDRRQHEMAKSEETWLFNDKYWQRDYSKCPDIF